MSFASGSRADRPDRLTLDRLPDQGSSLRVVFKDDGDSGVAVGAPREPHRHAYHELVWNRRGTGSHVIDGEACEVGPSTLTIIGRGQVHVFERGHGLSGAIVRFGEELLGDRSAGEPSVVWPLGAGGSRTIQVADAEVPRLEGLLDMMAVESSRRTDGWSCELQRHLLCTLLLWLARWHGLSAVESPLTADRDVRLHRRFVLVLERDFARHHDIAHYADALAVPPAALARALARISGHTTKELILDRVMLEAARLLRFSDLTVGEIAFRAGFGDQFYFSRAFKRHYGDAPLDYRAGHRGAIGRSQPPSQTADAA